MEHIQRCVCTKRVGSTTPCPHPRKPHSKYCGVHRSGKFAECENEKARTEKESESEYGVDDEIETVISNENGIERDTEKENGKKGKKKEADDLDACKLGLPNLVITKVLTSEQKNSSSSSVGCEGTFGGEAAFVKISFEADDIKHDNSLQIESEVYAKIVPLLSPHTPNLMPLLGKGECGNFVTSLKDLSLRKIIDQKVLKDLADEMRNNNIESIHNIDKMQLVVTKKAKGKKLFEWLVDEDLTSERVDIHNFMKDVLMQIAYTMVIFEDFGLMHLDLHAGNVFVEKLPNPRQYSINIGEKVLVRNINYFVQIYDFDHSTKVSTEFNDIILHNNLLDNDFCPRFGECNKFSKDMDWFTILESMYTYNPDLPYIPQLVDDDLLIGTFESLNLALRGHPCTCPENEPDCKVCTQFSLENLTIPPHRYLNSNFESCTTHCDPTFRRPLRKNSEGHK
jgi:hypothetical protein